MPRNVFSRYLAGCIGAFAALLAFASAPAMAAELVMFEQAGCVWCARFDREIAPIYPKTEEGRIAPLRRVDIDARLPDDLAFIRVERLTPLFVLIDDGREIGRIRGYPGEDNFWGLLSNLVKRIAPPPPPAAIRTERATTREVAALSARE